jgi:hypothetical protein
MIILKELAEKRSKTFKDPMESSKKSGVPVSLFHNPKRLIPGTCLMRSQLDK